MMRRFIVAVEREIQDEFLSRIMDSLRGQMIRINVMKDKIEISIQGTRDDIEHVWEEIKRTLRDLRLKRAAEKRGLTLINIEDMFRAIKGTIPLDALLEAIRAVGGKAERSSEYIFTTLSEDEVLGLAIKIKNAMEEVKYQVKGRALKSLIGILSAVTGHTPAYIIDVLVGMNAATYDEEGKLMLREDWRITLRKVIKEYEVLENSATTV